MSHNRVLNVVSHAELSGTIRLGTTRIRPIRKVAVVGGIYADNVLERVAGAKCRKTKYLGHAVLYQALA